MTSGARSSSRHTIRIDCAVPGRGFRNRRGFISPCADVERLPHRWNSVAPSFWLRRLQLRLAGEASLVAPQVMSVRLWPGLSLPPIQRIDGRGPDAVVDVVIETEHDVWTLLVPSEDAVATLSEDAADVAGMPAHGWRAGAHITAASSNLRRPARAPGPC